MFAAVQPGNSVTISEFVADDNHVVTAELFASLLDGVVDTLEPSEGATVQVRRSNVACAVRYALCGALHPSMLAF
jgi:hypothetical protein